MRKLRLLDLFCKAGGSSVGYARAGFDVEGVDIEAQKRYPFKFHQADALEYAAKHGHEFDLIAASPPCQEYSVTKSLKTKTYPDLVAPTRNLLREIGKPYVIENVPGAPLINPLMLCGTMFGLGVWRHRLFEIWPETIWFPPATCQHDGPVASPSHAKRNLGITCQPGFRHGYRYISVTGKQFLVADGRIAMGISWMTGRELAQAIPPAYTEWIGRQLIQINNTRMPPLWSD